MHIFNESAALAVSWERDEFVKCHNFTNSYLDAGCDDFDSG